MAANAALSRQIISVVGRLYHPTPTTPITSTRRVCACAHSVASSAQKAAKTAPGKAIERQTMSAYGRA
eukprot:4162412-Pleurochrysis_carterae.AAC.1